MNAERDDDTIAGAHRAAAQALDERPDPRVRTAVLAAAARAVDAKPHDAKQPARTTPFGSRRWGWSLAAVLVVSVMTGVVATRGWRERPDLIDGSADGSATRDVQAPPASPTASPPVAPDGSGRRDAARAGDGCNTGTSPGGRARPESRSEEGGPATRSEGRSEVGPGAERCVPEVRRRCASTPGVGERRAARGKRSACAGTRDCSGRIE